MRDLETALSLIDRFYDEHSPEFIEDFFADINNKEYEVVTLDEYISYFETAYTFVDSKEDYLYDEMVAINNMTEELSSYDIINIEYDSLTKGGSIFNHSYEHLEAA